MSGRRVIAGIDEAGLGPILGPLTLGFSVFEVPEDEPNLWKSLARVVCKDPRRARDRFAVADSKVVFARNPRGRARLESTAAGFLALLHPRREPPEEARDLLFAHPARLAPGEDELDAHPWYAHLPRPLLREVSPKVLELRVERLHRQMERAGVRLLDAGVRVVPSGTLNRSYDATRSKGLTLWTLSAPLLRHLWRSFAGSGLRVVVDRHGGRFRYRELLQDAFPRCELVCTRETPGLSEYRIRSGERDLRIAFAERAEERSFPVALASCLAKYARETCMAAFNTYFARLQPDLKPTAGYRNDGWRWIEDAANAVQRAELAPRVLVRER